MLHGEFLPDLFVVIDAISSGWSHQLPSTDRITCSWVGSEATAKESERESEEMKTRASGSPVGGSEQRARSRGCVLVPGSKRSVSWRSRTPRWRGGSPSSGPAEAAPRQQLCPGLTWSEPDAARWTSAASFGIARSDIGTQSNVSAKRSMEKQFHQGLLFGRVGGTLYSSWCLSSFSSFFIELYNRSSSASYTIRHELFQCTETITCPKPDNDTNSQNRTIGNDHTSIMVVQVLEPRKQ